MAMLAELGEKRRPQITYELSLGRLFPALLVLQKKEGKGERNDFKDRIVLS